jgi:hypothetical protein
MLCRLRKGGRTIDFARTYRWAWCAILGTLSSPERYWQNKPLPIPPESSARGVQSICSFSLTLRISSCHLAFSCSSVALPPAPSPSFCTSGGEHPGGEGSRAKPPSTPNESLPSIPLRGRNRERERLNLRIVLYGTPPSHLPRRQRLPRTGLATPNRLHPGDRPWCIFVQSHGLLPISWASSKRYASKRALANARWFPSPFNLSTEASSFFHAFASKRVTMNRNRSSTGQARFS